jgi:hypothetical protein
VNKLLIEAKASGPSVVQEMQRLHRSEKFSVELYNPKGQNKRARAISVKSKDVTEEGGAIWDLLLQEGSIEPKRSKPDDAIPF